MLRLELEKSAADEARIRAEGTLVLGRDTEQFREFVLAVVDKYETTVIDFENLVKIDSAGVGTLVVAYSIAEAGGHKLQVTNINGRVRELMDEVRLLTVFDANEWAALPR